MMSSSKSGVMSSSYLAQRTTLGQADLRSSTDLLLYISVRLQGNREKTGSSEDCVEGIVTECRCPEQGGLTNCCVTDAPGDGVMMMMIRRRMSSSSKMRRRRRRMRRKRSSRIWRIKRR
ncbi:hypothetical protein PoB_003882000 [Plakobranchus ocellatus]|uniref:Uncharacterized protein n=1 Tax=Plakobranchus ocellatus TaxID=259542 RepID=A0AAV4AZS2_9GAST|nr:hypothetical protein PoB_003882000 [Plakobranchus ocellatus]